MALVEKLNRDAGDVPPDAALAGCARARAGGVRVSLRRGRLGVLQSRLYRPGDVKAPLDESVQWLGVRDFLQEAEVAAGMVQRLLKEEPGLKLADIGLLLPDDFEYSVAVEDAFRLGGLALSGLPAERWRRDLGREAVFHFLYCRQKPAPAMALAVVLSSPLMPWSRETGAVLAQTVMDGDYELKAPHGASAEARAMLALLREGDTEPSTLAAALKAFAGLLDAPEELAGHVAQATPRRTGSARCSPPAGRSSGRRSSAWRRRSCSLPGRRRTSISRVSRSGANRRSRGGQCGG